MNYTEYNPMEKHYDLYVDRKICVLKLAGYNQPHVIYEPEWLIDSNEVEQLLPRLSKYSMSHNDNIALVDKAGQKVSLKHLILTSNGTLVYIRNFKATPLKKSNFLLRFIDAAKAHFKNKS
ncbi:hypothetical protein [Acanthopleuribacter pedis]|uniref:Uncharacterized protein n=1 Tax=Acanthopleuribacter pedis TaxID=442870 RepID=A0A8J7QVA0_9BACT|nr:hypothetical protein [Acanthopleuribacter pedis]MBO1323513.1 hypothetical protein [Acanthopleuribacter pedis]